MAKCILCEKKSSSGNAISHSQIHTKRRFKPNLQKVNGIILCTRCLKTLNRGVKGRERVDQMTPEKIEEVKEDIEKTE